MFVSKVLLLLLASWIACGGLHTATNSQPRQKFARNLPRDGPIPIEDKKERRIPPSNTKYSPVVTVQEEAISSPMKKEPALVRKVEPKTAVSSFSKSIVDIFFIFAEMPGFNFVHKQYYWVLPSVAAMLVKSTTRRNVADSEVRIHILSDTPLILQKAKALGYYTYDLLPFVDKHNKFLDRVALTVNGTENELTFFRWKVLNRIVTEWNHQAAENSIDRIVVINYEVLLTFNVATLYDRAVTIAQSMTKTNTTTGSVQPEAIHIADSIMLFSPHGLNAFDAFMNDWFNKHKRDEVRRKSVGTNRRGWSDIVLFEHFVNASTPDTIRVQLFNPVVPNASLEQQHIQALGCEPLPDYDNPTGVHVRVNGLLYELRNQPRKAKKVPQDPRIHDIHLVGPGKKYPYCFMGFSHRRVKNMLYIYGRALQILRGGDEAHTPTAIDRLFGDLAVSPEKSREVYYINSNSTRYFIANLNDFRDLKLAHEQVVGRVPLGVIEAFRPLPLNYPWKAGDLVSFGNGPICYFVDKKCNLRPLASVHVLKRFNLTFADVKTYKEYSGFHFNSMIIGPPIGLKGD